jgi:hypothetical protein
MIDNMTPTPLIPDEASQAEFFRGTLGRLVRSTWVAYCMEIGDTKPSHLAPWEELPEPDREADRRIGESVYQFAMTNIAAEELRHIRMLPTRSQQQVAIAKAAAACSLIPDELWMGISMVSIQHADVPTMVLLATTRPKTTEKYTVTLSIDVINSFLLVPLSNIIKRTVLSHYGMV